MLYMHSKELSVEYSITVEHAMNASLPPVFNHARIYELTGRY